MSPRASVAINDRDNAGPRSPGAVGMPSGTDHMCMTLCKCVALLSYFGSRLSICIFQIMLWYTPNHARLHKPAHPVAPTLHTPQGPFSVDVWIVNQELIFDSDRARPGVGCEELASG